jgi:hypothetical protein
LGPLSWYGSWDRMRIACEPLISNHYGVLNELKGLRKNTVKCGLCTATRCNAYAALNPKRDAKPERVIHRPDIITSMHLRQALIDCLSLSIRPPGDGARGMMYNADSAVKSNQKSAHYNKKERPEAQNKHASNALLE